MVVLVWYDPTTIVCRTTVPFGVCTRTGCCSASVRRNMVGGKDLNEEEEYQEELEGRRRMGK